MAENEHNVSLIIRARDAASAVINKVRETLRGASAGATADTQGLSDALEKTNATLAKTSTASSSVGRALDAAASHAEQTKAGLRDVDTSATEAAEALRSTGARAGEASEALKEMDADTRRLAQEVRALDAADRARVDEVRRSIRAQRDLAKEVGASALQVDRLKQLERQLDDRVARHARRNAAALRDQADAARQASVATVLLGRATAIEGASGLTRFSVAAAAGARNVATLSRGIPVLGAALGSLASMLTAAALGRWLLDSNRELQRLQAQLRTFTGDAASAAAKFEDIQRAALELPFELQDITQAFIALRGAGIDPSMSMLDAYANIAVSAQRNIADLGEAIRAASTGEMERLKAFNVVARVEGDKLAVTFQGVTKRIGRDSASIAGYLYDLGRIQFAGAAARQMDDLDGKISTLSDNLFKIATQLGRGGFTDAVADLTQEVIDLTDAISENEAEVLRWTGGIVQYTRTGLVAVVQLIRMVGNVVQIVTRTVMGFGAMLLATFGAILTTGIQLVRQFTEFVTQRQNETLRSLEASMRAYTESASQLSSELAQNALNDFRDIADAGAIMGREYGRLWGAVTSSGNAIERLTEAQRKNLSARRELLDDLRTEIALRRNLGTVQQSLARVITDAQAQIAAARARGVDWASEELRTLAQQVNEAAALMVAAQQSATSGGGGDKNAVAAIEERVQLLGRAAAIDETRSRALQGLARAEREVNNMLARRKLTLEQEVQLRDVLRAIAEAQSGDQVRREEIERLQERSAWLEENHERIAGLEREEAAYQRTVARGTAAAQEATAAERELAQVRQELEQLRRDGIAQGDGEAAAVERLTARERELSQLLVILNREMDAGAAATERLTRARALLAEARAVFTFEDLERLQALEAQLRAELAAELDKVAALEAQNAERAEANRHRERALELERQLREVEGLVDRYTPPAPGDEGSPTMDPPSLLRPDDLARRPENQRMPEYRPPSSWGLKQREDGQWVSPDAPEEGVFGRDELVAPSFLTQVASALEEIQTKGRLADETLRTLEGTVAGTLAAAFDAWGDAVSAAFEGIISGSESAGDAFKKAMLGAIANVAQAKGELALINATEAALTGNFAAAAGYLAAATAYFALAGMLGGAAGGGGGGGGGGGSSRSYDKQREDAGGSGEAVLEIYGDSINLRDPRQLQELKGALEKLSDRRLTVRVRPRGSR